MPFQSKAQRRKFYALKERGEMSQKTIDEWESHTPSSLPERKKTQEHAHRRKSAAYLEGCRAAIEKLGFDAEMFEEFAQQDATDEAHQNNPEEALGEEAGALELNNERLIHPPSPWTSTTDFEDGPSAARF
jgi:hypothetical protein